MLKCYIEGKNVVDGVEREFDISEGAVFTENYNETLDSGTIVIPHLTAEIDIEPFDVVVIYSTNDSICKITQRRMCVDTLVCTQTSLDPDIFKYEISLFSETKLLEGILLPSLSITRLTSNPRSVYYYINSYLRQYGTKLYSNGNYVDKFTISAEVSGRFSEIDCPEFQWNEPNLREVLNDLMMVDNCIVIVRNNVIDCIDISQEGTTISSAQMAGINYIQKSQSSQDYVSEIKTKIVNSVGENEVAKICENITFRNYDTYLLDIENVKVETSFPIWKLKKFYINLVTNVDITVYLDEPSPQGPWYYPDYKTNFVFTNRYYDDVENIEDVLEFGEWQTKDIYYPGGSADVVNNYQTEYQNTCLYYKRGDKGIFNFNAKQERIGAFWVPYQVSVLELIMHDFYYNSYTVMQMQSIIDEFLVDHPEYDAPGYAISVGFTRNDWKKYSFELEYETLGEYTLFASKIKTPFVRNQRQIVDNQTSSYVNAKTFGVLEYLKAKRLGNKLNLINARYTTDESNMPALAQKVRGSIIFRKEISVYDNFIKANYQATYNYVLRDYFTGIKAKLRSWPILSGNEAFVRSDNIKFYISRYVTSINTEEQKIPVYQDLQDYLNNFNYCVIKFKEDDGYSQNPSYLPSEDEIQFKDTNYHVDGYMVEFHKIICGNSALFTISMLDNAIVGKYVTDDDYNVGSNVHMMAQKNCRYVNAWGENYGGIIYFYKDYSIEGNPNARALCNLLPAVATSGENSGLSNLVAKIPFTFHKDNKEITQITVQFEYHDDANDIFIGKR